MDRVRPKTSQALSCSNYGIQIVSPAMGDRVDHSFPVNGIYRKLPKGTKIKVFTVKKRTRNSEYWPQKSAIINESNKTWYGKVNWVGGDSGETKEILVAIVGKEGLKF